MVKNRYFMDTKFMTSLTLKPWQDDHVNSVIQPHDA